MARSRTTWQPGQSGNCTGRPKTGEGIIKALADELNQRGKAGKLAKVLVKKALTDKADWRLQLEIFKYFFTVYQHEENMSIESRLDEIERRLNEICTEKKTG